MGVRRCVTRRNENHNHPRLDVLYRNSSADEYRARIKRWLHTPGQDGLDAEVQKEQEPGGGDEHRRNGDREHRGEYVAGLGGSAGNAAMPLARQAPLLATRWRPDAGYSYLDICGAKHVEASVGSVNDLSP